MGDLDVVNFNIWAKKPFREQAMMFLNAFWDEVSDQAEFIYSVSYKTLRSSDMHRQGISMMYDYREGNDVDFVTGLYFYEKLFETVHKPQITDGTVWAQKSEFSRSMPTKMTAVERKKTLSDQDLNGDSRISFLEYLLYQYSCDPGVFVSSCLELLEQMDPALDKARKALVEVNTKMTEYEKEKAALKVAARGDGPQAKKAQFQLKSIKNSALVSDLNTKLLKAEAAIRLATKKTSGTTQHPLGTQWWMERELDELKQLYGSGANLKNKSVNGPKKKKNDASWMQKKKKW